MCRDVEVIIVGLPEGSLPASHRHGQFEGLDRPGQEPSHGLVDQQMYVLRHNDVAGHNEQIAETNAFESIFKQFHCRNREQVGLAMKTTEGEEVELPRLLITDALAFHCNVTILRFGMGWDIQCAAIPGPQVPGTGGTLSMALRRDRDRGHPADASDRYPKTPMEPAGTPASPEMRRVARRAPRLQGAGEKLPAIPGDYTLRRVSELAISWKLRNPWPRVRVSSHLPNRCRTCRPVAVRLRQLHRLVLSIHATERCNRRV